MHGFLYVDGRLDDVIVRGAENISPGEIEEVLMAHAAVAEAAVIGIPDAEWGEAVAAVVVLHPGGSASAGAAGLGPGAAALHEDARRRGVPRRAAVLADREAPAAGAAGRAGGTGGRRGLVGRTSHGPDATVRLRRRI